MSTAGSCQTPQQQEFDSSQPKETSSRIGNESEQNNNNPQMNPSHACDQKTPAGCGGGGGGGGGGCLMSKRSSVQSNLSRHSNGGGHSLSSSTTNTSNEEIDQPASARMSNAEYEHVRNTTLLFFLDRLYLASREGKEARTLHDLSCLFGTREFTKEMRQIVGASRNGLKKFLQSYPSLFEIEGDRVYLTQLKQDTQVSQRDYNKEAVEYFKAKLLQFGASLVPIKNLFGYRSQASQEVRHVSGKNTRDFKQFLALNEDVFEILADEHVVLKTALAELESQGQTSMSLQQSLAPLPADDAIVMDPYLNKQFAHMVEECLKKMVPELDGDESSSSQARVTLEQVYEQIQKQCQNELFLKMVKTLDDLRVFLRMHPKIFKRTKSKTSVHGTSEPFQEFVSLLSENERRDLDAAAYPTLHRQHSTLAAGPTSLVFNRSQVARQSSHQQQVVSEHEVPFSSLPPQPRRTHSSGCAAPAALAQDSSATKQVVPTRKPPKDRTFPHQAQKTQDQQQLQQQSLSRPPSSQSVKQPAVRQASSSLSSHQNQNQHGHQLRANAAPFVPPSRELHPAQSQQQYASMNTSSALSRQNSALAGQHGFGGQKTLNANHRAVVQRSHSNLNQSATTRHHQQQQEITYQHQHQQAGVQKRPPLYQDLPPIDHRLAIKNYLLKDNTNHSQHMSWTSPSGARLAAGQGQQMAPQPSPAPPPPPPPPPSSPPSADEMRARTVDMVREASNIITKIMTTTDAVAFDCKGYNLGFDGQITLIQFGYLQSGRQVDPTRALASSMRGQSSSTGHDENEAPLKPEVCVFDLITNPELAYCLKPLLESDKIVKIVHDVRNKSNALYVQFKIILNNVFDTQVANLVIQQQDTGKPAYKSRYISMSKLCEIYGGDELMRYRNLIKLKTSRAAQTASHALASQSSSSSTKDVNYWRARPLTKPMIFEATMDVYCLVGGIYQNLKAKIKPEYEPLFDQLNLEGVLARIRPDEIRSAKKERKIDLEVIDLKRKLYSDTLGPVVLSNREIRLLRHIDLTDEVRAKIQQCKKVAKKLERLDLKATMLMGSAKQIDGGAQMSSLSSNGTSGGECSLPHTGARLSRQSSSDQSNHNLDVARLEAGELQLRSITSKLDELNATGMMMDSSMFDELKDKMIESSSLLESLEDDDDDDEDDGRDLDGERAAIPRASLEQAARLHSNQGSAGGDCCHCQCHSSASSSIITTSNHSSHTSTDLTSAPTSQVETEAAIEANDTPALQLEASKTSAIASKAKQEQNESDLQSKGDIEERVQLEASLIEQETQQIEEPTTTNTTTNTMTTTTMNDHSISSNDSKSSTGCDMGVQCDLLS